MPLSSDVFLREPPHRPSHTSSLDGLSLEQVYERFLDEQRVLQEQLNDCETTYIALLDMRAKRKQGQTTFEQNTQLAQGFHLKTEINDNDAFIVSLGLDGAYVELELEEAIAFSQRREQYLRVALERIKDRLSGLAAEMKMQHDQLADILRSVQQ